jgi:hypothetical protein
LVAVTVARAFGLVDGTSPEPARDRWRTGHNQTNTTVASRSPPQRLASQIRGDRQHAPVLEFPHDRPHSNAG